MTDALHDTVFALATPALPGPRAVVRVTGPQAFRVAAGLESRAVAEKPEAWAFTSGRARAPTAHPTTIHLASGAVPAEFWLATAPHSASGEDLLEVHLPGSPLLLRELTHALVRMDCSPAAPGEFTRRALLNGKLDLACAEAVMLLVSSGSADAARRAQSVLGGSLTTGIANVVTQLEALCARLELSFDFDEDAATQADTAGFARLATETLQALHSLTGAGPRRDAGVPTVVLAGPANAGKSTLFNALLRRERAAVSDEAGTTRDVVWEEAVLAGARVRLADTAGLKQASGEIEQVALARGRETAFAAELVLVVIDAAGNGADEVQEAAGEWLNRGARLLVVRSKLDLAPHPARLASPLASQPTLAVAARLGEGVPELAAAIADTVRHAASPESPAVSERGAALLEEARLALSDAVEGLQSNAPIEAVSDLGRVALSRLREFLGREASRDVLDHVFANFCIGK